ncbi:MAG: GGDEF domain-containing protein [Anaerolineae bacterium]|nr:MAG: GGDEF domain-containing protein [Anaerolineae bacterium]
MEAEGVAALAIFQLPSPAGVLGTLALYWDSPRRLSVEEINIGHLFAFRSGQALHNARLHAKMRQQSVTDALTGLPNRRALDRFLDGEVNRAARYQYPFALIMLDMDGFKQVNDRLGHDVGDQVLVGLGRCLRAVLRESDFIARFGGDEFTVVAPHTDLQGALHLADKIRQAVETCDFGLSDIPLSVSQGVGIFPHDGRSAADLLRCADQALYRAKRSRPGMVIYAGDDDFQEQERPDAA